MDLNEISGKMKKSPVKDSGVGFMDVADGSGDDRNPKWSVDPIAELGCRETWIDEAGACLGKNETRLWIWTVWQVVTGMRKMQLLQLTNYFLFI